MTHREFVTIALTGGGSGGHITPLLSLAHELKSQDPNCQIVYIGHKGDQFDSLRAGKHDFDFMAFVNGGKFRRYHGESLVSHLFDIKTMALNVRDFFRVINSVGTAYRILSRAQPDVLFVKGGFVGVPVGLAARLKGIPIITHDSDTVGGLANRIVGRWAKVHATGMPAKYYRYSQKSVHYVGIPLDTRVEPVTPAQQADYKAQLNLPKDGQLIFVAGGGNGSKKLNDLMAAAAKELLKSRLNVHIVNLTGHATYQTTVDAYSKALDKEERGRVSVLDFTDEFYKYSGAADLIISRAGATSIAEFALQGKACIIIPSPFLAAGHQLKNAEMLKEHDAAVILDEDTTPEGLLVVIKELLQDDHRRWQLASNLKSMAKPGASQKLAKLILNTAKNE